MSRYAKVLGVTVGEQAVALDQIEPGADRPAGGMPREEAGHTDTDPAGTEGKLLDPRPDLEEDTEVWEVLLSLAMRRDLDLGETLKGFRCCGTRLKRVQGKWVLRPDVDPTGAAAWVSVEEYAEAREKFLRPRQEEVTKLLEWLGGLKTVHYRGGKVKVV